MKSLAVIIPFYNEERTIGVLLDQLSEISPSVVSQVILVDDGSTDNSRAIAEEKVAQLGLNATIKAKPNGGKSSAVDAGRHLLGTTHCLILDADLELSVQDIPRMWSVVIDGTSDFVFGYRVFRSHSSFTWRYSKGNLFISNMYGLFFNELITDIMCGYKLVTSDFIRTVPFAFKGFGMEIEIPLYLFRSGIKPYEMEVQYVARTRDQGKSISVKDAFTIIVRMLIFRVRHRKRVAL